MEKEILIAWEKTIKDIKSLNDDELKEIFLESLKYFKKNQPEEQIIIEIINDYKIKIKEILKITPGLSTGLMDIKDNIIVNTYDGTRSDIEEEKIDRETVFDVASTTKLFTILLLLKEEEKGNIDLSKNYSDYSNYLKEINIPIIEALRFMIELRTDGRIDEKNISKQEIIRRINKTYIYKRNYYKYSDIPYLLVPLLFGKTKEEATENYLKTFYETFRSIGLTKTGYSTVNMTGGIITRNKKNILFDPKTQILETNLGYISGHAGVTTNIEDLEKLFIELKNGFLKRESLEKLIKPNNNSNRGLAVYLNQGDISKSPVHGILGKKAFAISGSTGSYAVFDLENGLMTTFLANIKSTTKSKEINTGNIYTFGDNSINVSHNYITQVIGGTNTIKDGRIIDEKGNEITFFRSTNNFKKEQLKTLIKLKFIKNYLNIENINYISNEKKLEIKK